MSFRFRRPSGFDYRAGQFFFISLPGEGDLRKPFSFSSSPTEDHIELTTRLSNSDFKRALSSLRVGATVGLEGPFGQFTLREGMDKAAFLSGGIGITPIRSIIKYVSDTGLGVEMVLIYSNRDAASVIFKEDLEHLAGSAALRIVHCLGEAPREWKGCRGRITRSVVEAEVSDLGERVFYVCGPPGMVEAMRAVLSDIGVDARSVVIERFAGYD